MKIRNLMTITMVAASALMSGAVAQDAPEIIQVAPTGLFASGNGTEANPYILSTRQHLANMKRVLKADETVYFKMIEDIDMTGMYWEPLNYADPYNKRIVFDGQGHILKNFFCNYEKYPSFFGVLYGECRNVRFVNPVVYSELPGASHIGIVGGYVGTAGKPGIVEKVSVEGGTVFCYWTDGVNIGGIAGNTNEATIRNCSVDTYIRRHDDTSNNGNGGIAGYAAGSTTIENCFATGKIEDTRRKDSRCGGILGYTWNNATLNNNIGWMTRIQGKFVAGCICGTTTPAGTNYGYSETVFDTSTNTDNYNSWIQGTLTDNAISAAKAMNWDETIWDLTDSMPKLRWE